MTKKQEIFVNEYLVDLNATRAYMVAYPRVKSDKVAAASAARMLRNVKVEEKIKIKMQERIERVEITQDMVLRELAVIAFSKYTDYGTVVERQAFITDKNGNNIALVDKNGKPLMVKDIDYQLTQLMPESAKKAIKSIKPGKNGLEVELYDKEKALELLGRHLGMFKDKVELSGIDEEKSKLDMLISQIRGDND